MGVLSGLFQKKSSESSKNKMNDQEFWKLISIIDWNQSDNENQLNPIIVSLSKYTLPEIFKFEGILAEKLYQLDGKAFAENIGDEFSYKGTEEYFSVDFFLYVRSVVVANGEAYFNSIIENPMNMPQDIEYEPLLYVASEAYSLKTGESSESFYDKVETKYSYETYSNKELWEE